MTRSLRIAVVLGGRIVEERLFSTATPITFGQSLRCTLSVPADGVPQVHVLFACDDGRFVLRRTPAMDGRLGQHGQLQTFAELAATEIPLARGARGKLSIGDATILFQEIATPPAAPRPRLPASVRGTFADRIDRRLAVIIGGSLVAHIAIAAWAWSTDVDTELLGAPPVAQITQETIDVTLPDFATPTTPPTPGIASPVAPHQTPTPIVRPTQITAHAPTADDALRMASILAGEDETPNGPGGMSRRQPGIDLAKQIDDARHHRVTIGDNGHTSRVDDTARIGTDPNRPLVDDPTLTRTTHRTADLPPITFGPIQTEEPTSLTPDSILKKIGDVYMSGLQRCYRKGLLEDAELAGKVAIGFTVDHHGRVTAPTASGVSAGVDSCVASAMAAWHFPAPTDKDGEPTDASFHIGLVLRTN